ncbi:MAG: DNA repair protein RecO [Candidatus Pacebacteria bacterium]|nr:DNA repair protein RecO [Candidatus Paceibacterota bacterium]
MFEHYRTRGFVIKKTDRGEADRLFTVYTEDFGKLELIARSERKIKSKLRVGLEMFYFSEIEFIQGKAYKTLTDAILINQFPEIKKNLGKWEIASRISVIIDLFIRGQESDPAVWQLLKEVFRSLNDWEAERTRLKLIYFYFLWNFLSILGYGLEFYRCISCRQEVFPENMFLNIREGGVLCLACQKKVKDFKTLDAGSENIADLIKILKVFSEEDIEILKNLRVEEGRLKALQKISHRYLLETLEKTK